MRSNAVGVKDDTPLPKKTWRDLVEEQVQMGQLKGATCHIYSTTVTQSVDERTHCICGRKFHRHSFSGPAQTQFAKHKNFKEVIHATSVDLKDYGQLDNDARFIRCDTDVKNTLQTLAQLVFDDVGKERKPNLLISCYGGAKYFRMNDNLEKEFRNGIAQAATTEGVWVLTTGLNSGVSKFIGQSINHHMLLNKRVSKPTVIGLNSWGTVSERTREMLRWQAQDRFHHTWKSIDGQNPLLRTLEIIGGQNPLTIKLSADTGETLEEHHTHFVLLDKGRVNDYLDDKPRSDFVKAMREITKCHAITIIVDGGIHTLEVIENDLKAEPKRPVIIIQGSGRLANALGKLLESASGETVPSNNEIEECLKQFPALWPPKDDDETTTLDRIREILNKSNRPYLKVLQLKRGTSLTDTIFRAVFSTKTNDQGSKVLLHLALSWNCIDGAHELFKRIREPDEGTYYPTLFERALKENRPAFVDYFLRRYHNPLHTTAFISNNNKPIVTSAPSNSRFRSNQDCITHSISPVDLGMEDRVRAKFALEFILHDLYNQTEAPSDRWTVPHTLDELDQNYTKLIGPYVGSFYFKQGSLDRLWRYLSLCIRIRCSSESTNKPSTKTAKSYSDVMELNKDASDAVVNVDQVDSNTSSRLLNGWDEVYEQEEMLRDLLLWSVYAGYADIAFVILLQLKSRIGPALLAAAIARRLSSSASNLDTMHTFLKQAESYEMYATECITACHSHNERLACQLLLREIPLLGNITCMQIAIASRNMSFINTHCVDQVLIRQWYGELDGTAMKSPGSQSLFVFNLSTFGLLAPWLLVYRSADVFNESPIKGQDDVKIKRTTCYGHIRLKGINEKQHNESNYFQKLKKFHGSPAVMMFYHFCVYIWFLLVFSYMMLFHMATEHDSIHWTEIYVIITVAAMHIEDLRKLIFEYQTQMQERWHSADLWIVPMYALPYILFYIGIGLHFGSSRRPDLFTAARIVLAIDLEVWYLFSLRFVSAVKLLGPKLFMIRNMMRDLTAFIYLIFVCIAAYGVVSRALIMYSSLTFTAKDLLMAIFYRPYWFLYSIVDDEKNDLDNMISSNTSTANVVAEATVTQVLLSFHMLFINILILNLLIAAFNFSITDVQLKNKFFWRYQRYELIREYFEKPMFAFPPLSLLVYIWLIGKIIVCQGLTFRVFKRLETSKRNIHWTSFENAATYAYARKLVEDTQRFPNQAMHSEASAKPKNDLTLQTRLDVLTRENTQLLDSMQKMEAQMNKMTTGMNWMMKAMKRVKMSKESPPIVELPTSSDA